MEVEATSLGATAFAAPSPGMPDLGTPQAPSPSPLNSPWPEPETAIDQPEEGATLERNLHSVTESLKNDNQGGKSQAHSGGIHDAQNAVLPAADNQIFDSNSQSKPPPDAASHPLPAATAPKPPVKPISLAQSLFPEDFEDEAEAEEKPQDTAPPPQQSQSAEQAPPQPQTQPEQQTQSLTQDTQPPTLEQTQPDKQALSQSLSLEQSIDPLDQSQPLQPQTPTKDYSELANAVADLNLPTNSLFPAQFALDAYEAEEAAPVQDAASNDPMQAFAKLQFPDGDFYVNTYAVELGRDLNAAKYERKAGRMHKMKLKRDVQMDQEADIKMEDDGHNMARSNVSESGGIVGVNIEYDSEDNEETKRRKRKQFRSTNSSHSVDPTSLHANPYDLSLDWQPQQDKPFEYECPFIPIHPEAGQSFKNISRKHIRIEYNLQKAVWEMLVNGRNGAFHDDVHLEKGSLVKLHHGSEILVQGITIIFKLPDNARDEDEEEEAAHLLSDTDSSLSDLDSVASAAFGPDYDDVASSEDEPLRLKRPVQKKERPKKIIKLKFSLKKNFPAVAGKPVEKEEKKDKEKEKERKKEKDKEKEKTKDKEREKAPETEKEREKEKAKERRPSKSGKQSVKTDKPARLDKAEKTTKADKTDKAERAEKTEKVENAEKPKKVEQVEKAEKAEKTIVAPKPDAIKPTIEDRRESVVSTTEMPPPSQPIEVKNSIEAETLEALQQAQITPSETPPAIPADLPPGSILAGLAPEEIPQKRKGPGRPPKNGVMSKRDEAIIKRKTKEFQKLGKAVPPLAELLALARAEGGSTTKKDAKSEDIREGEGVSQSMEIDPALMALQEHNNATPSAEVKSEGGIPVTQPTPDKDANKPKRIVKSPSPQKPESEYTEDELKKPTQTYVVLIHEALSKSPTGVMDLQQIYDAMQKMYPWFKYRSTTHGWQSSVRHNLISSEAFEEAGKIGKGRLWKINPNVSIDKEKKRKAPTPPPAERPPQQYPYYPNNQYPYGHPGAPAYGAYARPSPYGAPYGPPTVQNVARPPVPTPQQKPGTYYSPYASTTPGAAAHGSPYGPPSRAPYAPYPQPPRPPGSVYGQPSQPPQHPAPGHPGQAQPGQAPHTPQGQQQQAPPQPGQGPHPPPGQAYHPSAGQPPVPPNGQPQYSAQGQPQPRPIHPQNQVPGQNPPPPPQNQSGITSEKMIDNIMDYHKRYLSNFQGPEQEKHRAIFRKATNRHIHRGEQHGPFESEEEEKLFKAIQDIITSTQAETASTAPAQPQSNGPRPMQTVQPQAQPPSTPVQGAAGHAPPPANAPAQYPRPPGQSQPPAFQQQPQPSNGQAPQTSQATQAAMTTQPPASQPQSQQTPGSGPPEKDLAQALKTAMPAPQVNGQSAPTTPAQNAPPGHQDIAPRPTPYAQPVQAQAPQQRMQPSPAQQQMPQARPNVATVPPNPQTQAPRPTFTAPSHPASAASTPVPQSRTSTAVAPRPVAPAQAPIAPAQTTQPSPVPSQAAQPASTTQAAPMVQPGPPSAAPQPSAPSPAPAPQAQSQAPTPAQAVQTPIAPRPAPVAQSPAPSTTAGQSGTSTPAPAASVPTNGSSAGSSLKRPIEIDDDGDHEAKKQRTDGQT